MKHNDRLIAVRLPDGEVIRLTNRGKKEKRTLSEMVRIAIRKFLGL